MPSTPDVKNELVRVQTLHVGERMSELATVLRLAGGLHTISGRIALEAELHTPPIVQRVRKDLAELYGVRSDAKQMPAASTRPGSPQKLKTGIRRATSTRKRPAAWTGMCSSRWVQRCRP